MSNFQTFERNGLNIHIMPIKKYVMTTIAIRIYINLDAEIVTGAAMLPYLMLQGSREYKDNKELQINLDRLFGATLKASVDKKGEYQILCLSMTLPNQENIDCEELILDKGIEIITDVLLNPRFDSMKVEEEKMRHARRIKSRSNDRITYSLERCLAKITKGNPYEISKLGETKKIDRWGVRSLYDLHKEIIRNSPIHLYVIGDVDAKSIVHKFSISFERNCKYKDDLFSKRQITSASPIQLIGETQIFEPLSLKQSLLNIAHGTGGVVFSSKDYPALVVCNRILGGFPHSKLFVNLRKKHGLAYYISSSLDALKGILYIQCGVKPNTVNKSISIIQKQLEQIKEGVLTQEDVDATITAMCNMYKISMDSPGNLIDFHQNGVVAGNIRTMGEMVIAIQSISVQDVIRVSQKIKVSTIHIVGPNVEVLND
ncbi:insulinase family protein [Bacillus anthracis]|uniref:EF-P 5-aminopentanol modification-associated protein YfmF n=1 Tax=Bacillus sp. N35-10-4 TaxID=1866315 RepID=UPI0008FDA94A|nr:pitrilysin family protein [Bacillus sp. N35-10-4]OJD55686.1 hypothetical protein BAU26_25850 [Bacillus sp. N35-10-4]PFM20614.1 insulinase family protein [Bacillus anthracis]PGH91977.1 insulinase family protein [Bacillus anthracis]PGP22909.1 insulinase family protein [Bacillus anthracis]